MLMFDNKHLEWIAVRATVPWGKLYDLKTNVDKIKAPFLISEVYA